MQAIDYSRIGFWPPDFRADRSVGLVRERRQVAVNSALTVRGATGEKVPFGPTQ